MLGELVKQDIVSENQLQGIEEFIALHQDQELERNSLKRDHTNGDNTSVSTSPKRRCKSEQIVCSPFSLLPSVIFLS